LVDVGNPNGAQAGGLAVTDVNGDQALDLVVTNLQNDSVSVRLGNGDGTFGPRQAFHVGSRTTGGNTAPVAIAFADLNGDGFLDFVDANVGSNSVSVRLNG